MRRLTEAAQAAKAIKLELKQKFPNIKFRVRSDNFSMGDSVDIYWTDGPTYDAVNSVTKKYQYGRFDGMIDLYENTNNRDDIPQSKYVMCNREYTPEILESVKQSIADDYGIKNTADEREWQKITNSWSYEKTMGSLSEMTFDN